MSSQNSRMTVRNDFLFLGGHVAIDFLNTEVIADGQPLDKLAGPDDLSAWLAAADLGEASVSARTLAAVKRLRGEFREVVLRMADGYGAKKSVVEAINEALRRGRGALQLHAHGRDLRVAFEPEEADALFLVARAAAEFLATAEPTRIRRCEGTNCILLFYDTTKSGTRRWCSMAGCGNRMKAALHYARRREAQE